MEISASGILSRMFEMTKNRFGALLGLWIIYFVAQIVFSFLFVMVAGASVFASGAMSDPNAFGAFGVGMIVSLIVFYVLYLLIYAASYASMAHMASPLLQPRFGDSFNAGIRSALTLLGVMVLLIVAYIALAFALSLLAIPLASAGNAGSIVMAIVFVPVLIYLGCRLSIVFPLVAVENIRNPITAIGRSWSLTGGSVLSILGAMIAYIVIVVVLLGLVFAPLLLGGSSFGDPAAGIATMAFVFIGAIVATIVVTILGAALASAIHAGLAELPGGTLSETFE